jgi:hypothetical protein
VGNAMITEGQVRVTIAILCAYTAGELALEGELLDKLEDAIEEAFDARCDDIDSSVVAMSA